MKIKNLLTIILILTFSIVFSQVEKTQIKGKVMFSYWGKTNDRINIDFRNK